MLLAISTSTEALSAALWDGDALLGAAHEVIGRGHAERLLPVIAAVAGDLRADEILVDCGPGSFTGVRVGLAAARGLGIAWSAPVRGFSSLPLIAAAVEGAGPIAIANRAGHGEVFWQMFRRPPLQALDEPCSLPPAEAARLSGDAPVFGTGADLVGARGGTLAYPDTRYLPQLPPEFLQLPPRPLYLRAPDAKRPA